jgi:integrase
MLFPTMLRRKNGFLYLRKAIPKACRPAMGGRRELLISLKTRDPELAKLRWKIVSARVDAMLSAARRGTTVPLASSLARLTAGLDDEQREAFESYLLMKLEDDDADDRPLSHGDPKVRGSLSHQQRAQFKAYFNQPPAGTPDNPLLSAALAKRLAETSPTAKSSFAWNVSLQRFRSLACEGADLPVRSVTRAHLVRFRDGLLKLPSKRGGTLTPQSAVKDINAIKGLLTYSLAQGWIETNPGAGLSVAAKGTNGKSDRLPYETNEARALLTAAATMPEGPNKYLPMILAYSGMRLSEAGGLRCDDVKKVDGVWMFSVEENADRRIKTASSRRVVAIHSKLIEAGLLVYADARRAAGHDRLFHTLRASIFNGIANAWGKFYSRWSRKIVPDRKKTAHSWRHTVATKLRQANVREDLMDELLGWTRSAMNARYGSGFTVVMKAEAIERVRY